jgi:hypothetical protein
MVVTDWPGISINQRHLFLNGPQKAVLEGMHLPPQPSPQYLTADLARGSTLAGIRIQFPEVSSLNPT